LGITIFGTSAKYISALDEAGYKPGNYDLQSPAAHDLLHRFSAAVDGFEYAYREIKADMQLASISGGTDLNGCFALGNPTGPVYPGQLQCRALAMKVKAYNDNGQSVVNETGELVCEAAFPSMPVYFWDDPDGEKYLDAYFRKYPGIWCHGDFIKITEQDGVIIYGRSDATLNPGGVRIGTADIYSVLDTLEEVSDSLVVGQDWENDVRIILFVKLNEGHTLDDDLTKRIKKAIRTIPAPGTYRPKSFR
jgi:acetoacetyl-CoA synthetase